MSQTIEQPNQTVNDEAEFEPLKGFESDYEIQKDYPFVIRKKSNNRVLKEFFSGCGYIQVCLNRKTYYKHRLIAFQFISNPDNLPEVDHVNHNRADNRLENLRFVSSHDNSINKASNKGVLYEYVDSLPEDAIIVNEYTTRNNHHEFENYFYHNDVFYFFNGIKYRKLNVHEKANHSLCVQLIDINNRYVSVYYSKFKQQHDLI